jgi:hypothetical protein
VSLFFEFTGMVFWAFVIFVLFMILIGKIEIGVDKRLVEKKDD